MFDVNTPNAKYNKQPCMDAIRSRIQHLQSLVEKHPLDVRVCNADAVTEKYTDSIIYCDPPYFGARNHSWCDKAESRFWDEVYGWLSPGSGNLVYVSSHRELKKDHKLQLRCIWSQRMPNHCGGAGGYRIEYLYAVQRRRGTRGRPEKCRGATGCRTLDQFPEDCRSLLEDVNLEPFGSLQSSFIPQQHTVIWVCQ